jgi:hypothetical protein
MISSLKIDRKSKNHIQPLKKNSSMEKKESSIRGGQSEWKGWERESVWVVDAFEGGAGHALGQGGLLID